MKKLLIVILTLGAVQGFACPEVKYDYKIQKVSDSVAETFNGINPRETDKKFVIDSKNRSAVERTYINSDAATLKVTVSVNMNCQVESVNTNYDGF